MKKELGANCTFLSTSKEKINGKEADCILVYFKNELGGKDKVRIPLNKSFSALTLDDYNYIYNELKNGNRGENTI